MSERVSEGVVSEGVHACVSLRELRDTLKREQKLKLEPACPQTKKQKKKKKVSVVKHTQIWVVVVAAACKYWWW